MHIDTGRKAKGELVKVYRARQIKAVVGGGHVSHLNEAGECAETY